MTQFGVGAKGRVARINQHVAGLNSGNPQRVKAAKAGLKKMNLSYGEQAHVHSQLVRGFNPAKAAFQKHGGGFGSALEHAGSVAYHASPIPGMVNAFSHPSEFIGGDQARVERTNRQQSKAVASELEATTGYKEIKKIRQHPIAGSIALASVLPIGKVARLGELGVDAARGIDAAEQAQKVASAAQDARGLKKVALQRRAVRLARRGAPRTDQQATAHVLATAKRARQQGFGRIIPKKPELAPGAISPETGGEAGRIIRQGLRPDFKGMGKYEKLGAKLDNPGVGTLRNRQEELRSIERAKRAGSIEKAYAKRGGLQGHIAAKQALEGQLPAKIFKGFDPLTSELRDQAIKHIYDHPHFQPFEKVRATDALQEALAGKVPTEGDQKLLERAFGLEKEGGLKAVLKNGGLKDKVINALNVPRSLMASFDLSAPFRQGLVVSAHSPRLFASEFGRMFKAASSEDAFQGIMQEIHQRPTFPLMEKAKLGLTDIGETAKGTSENLSKREEQFISNYAEQIPGIGHIVRGSDRGYVGFLNKTRADLFDSLLHQAAGQGYHLNDKLVEDISKFVNSATGRGDMSKLADHTATMNAFFFSPRLLKSRLDFLNPVYYMRMEPFARRQALKAALRLVGTLSTVLYAAKMAGATVVTDPRNADFAKIRIGNVRIDPAGGFTQPIRLLVELSPGFMGGGEIISSTTGRKEYLTGAFGHSSRLAILENFAEGKLAPVPGFLAQSLQGQQFGGGRLDWSPSPADPNSLITSHYLPLLAQDIEGLRQQTHNNAEIGGLGLADLFGVGVQSYSAKKHKGRSGGVRPPSTTFGGSSGGSSFGSGSGGSSFP